MIGWVMVPLRRYAEFGGRSSRAEFWKWILVFYGVIILLMSLIFFRLLVSIGRGTLGVTGSMVVFGILAAIIFFGGLLPTIAIQVRRLHDTNHSGFWLLGSVGLSVVDNVINGIGGPDGGAGVIGVVLGIASGIYSIVLLVFYCLPGTQGENDYGPSPYANTDLEALSERFR
jgi:uncharacterized membrane protein YhaH (DUF805 family)